MVLSHLYEAAQRSTSKARSSPAQNDVVHYYGGSGDRKQTANAELYVQRKIKINVRTYGAM